MKEVLNVRHPYLQSGHETNDLLKSGPAQAGPAGPATPPLLNQINQIFIYVSLVHLHNQPNEAYETQ